MLARGVEAELNSTRLSMCEALHSVSRGRRGRKEETEERQREEENKVSTVPESSLVLMPFPNRTVYSGRCRTSAVMCLLMCLREVYQKQEFNYLSSIYGRLKLGIWQIRIEIFSIQKLFATGLKVNLWDLSKDSVQWFMLPGIPLRTFQKKEGPATIWSF